MLEDVLKEWGAVEVTALDVYTDIFKLGEGFIQTSGEEPGEFKANPIAYWKNNDAEHGHFRIMFEDTFEDTLLELQKADFAILNGLTYFGRRNVQSHVSKMYALPFDLDDVTDKTLANFLSGAIIGGAYPVPQYIALSGHGIHLYYVFERPIPLFPNLKLQLKDLKYALTKKLWNQYTSMSEEPQYQGINQGFRVLGGKTKDDAIDSKVRVFRLNEHPTNLDQLCEFVPDEFRVDEDKLFKESKLTLAEAKKKYPEWYEKVVIKRDRTPKKWDIAGKVNGDNPYALYDWWKRQIQEGAAYGRRYFNIMCLAIYGIKCGVPYEKVEEDAYALIPFMNSLKIDKPFTIEDVDVALECYDFRYCTFPRKDIAKISGIDIKENPRNYRSMKEHLQADTWINKKGRPVINICKQNRELALKFMRENGEITGRPDKSEIVNRWRKENPDGRKVDCIRETGLSKNTVYKWWNGEEEYYRMKELEKKSSTEIIEELDNNLGEVIYESKEQEEIANLLAKSLIKLDEEQRKKVLLELMKMEK